MLIKPKLEYTALLGDKIEISLQYFEIEQRIIGYCFLFKQPSCLFLFFCYVDDRGERWRRVGGGGGAGMLQSFFLFGHVFRPEDFRGRRLVSLP